MKQLLKKIENLRKTSIRDVIAKRIKEFESIGGKEVFSELCFCILTANSNAENCIRVQKQTSHLFETLEEKKLAEKFKEAGCRFHTKRAGYIAKARENKVELLENIKNLQEAELRIWIADNIKGLGMKESSHFLRNIGYKNVAIIDFHIVDLLEREGLVKKPKNKSLSRGLYLEIENILGEIAKKANLNLAELDLYLWYMETGKILK